MKRPKKEKISISPKDTALTSSPFDTLNTLLAPASLKNPSTTARSSPTTATATPKAVPTKKGRLDILRVKSGRGGKTVTVIRGDALAHLSRQELKALTLELKKACAVGGTLDGNIIEIQGDQRTLLAQILHQKGYTPVIAGG